ncbi:hypothetical protein B0H13DRAFT_2143770 [Mycena leptocephala]|nr:hypothetical protein B0H13DRAFT_2143770 [Mycena leptocephala]
MPCLCTAGACAILCPVASLLIVTQVECLLPRIPAKETTRWPLWCGECLRQFPIHLLTRVYRVASFHFVFTALYVFHSFYQLSAHNLSSAASFIFYSLAATSSITQGLNCVACRVGGRGRRAMACRIVQ